jgi:hypothetical protein
MQPCALFTHGVVYYDALAREQAQIYVRQQTDRAGTRD